MKTSFYLCVSTIYMFVHLSYEMHRNLILFLFTDFKTYKSSILIVLHLNTFPSNFYF